MKYKLFRNILFGLLIFTTSLYAAPKYRVAILLYGNHNISTFYGFQEGLESRGIHEGRDVTYIFHGVIHSISDLEAEAKRLISEKPDLIYTATTPATQIAFKANAESKIPIVFGPVNDPVKVGVVNTYKEPGSYATGIRLTENTAKRIEWLTRLAPHVKKILIPYNPKDKSALISCNKARQAAEIFNIQLVEKQLTSSAEIDNFLQNFPDDIQGIFMPRDGLIMSRTADIAKIAIDKKIVLSGIRLEMARQGALFSYGFNGEEMGKQASRLAYQILVNGTSPASIPVETAEDYLTINIKTAQSIGLVLNNTYLRQAHSLIRE